MIYNIFSNFLYMQNDASCKSLKHKAEGIEDFQLKKIYSIIMI